jgi:ubiquinol-cytochrome c reductase cytochrome b subunit
MPQAEFRWAGVAIPFEVLLPAILLPLALFTLLAAYPFLEAKLTRDRTYHDQLDRPRDHPVRTGLGAMALAFYGVLFLAGGDVVLSTTFNISLNTLVWTGRVLLFVVPPLAYKLTASWCRGLMQDDDDEAIEGIHTGIIVRSPSGEFIEVTTRRPEPEVPVQVPADPEETDHAKHPSTTRHAGSIFQRTGAKIVDFFVERR